MRGSELLLHLKHACKDEGSRRNSEIRKRFVGRGTTATQAQTQTPEIRTGETNDFPRFGRSDATPPLIQVPPTGHK